MRLNQLGKFLQANPKTFVAVRGFTDNRGAPEYNIKLSRERAEKVTDYLVKTGKPKEFRPGSNHVVWRRQPH